MAGDEQTCLAGALRQIIAARVSAVTSRVWHLARGLGQRRWEQPALLAGVTLLVACALGAFILRQAAIQTQEIVIHAHEVRYAAVDVLDAMRDAETGERGFLLTVDPQYLEPYVAATGQLEDLQSILRTLTMDNPEQRARTAVLDSQIADKLGKLSQAIDFTKSGQLSAAVDQLKDNSGKRTMDAIRTTIAELSNAETVLPARRQGSLIWLQNAGLAAMLLGFLLSAGLAVTAIALLKGQAAVLNTSNAMLVSSNRSLDDRIALQSGKLQLSQAQHEFALDASGLGEWSLDAQSDQSVRSARHDQIFGCEAAPSHWGFTEFIDHVVAEDQAAVKASYAATLASGADWQFECRIKRGNDAAIRWIEVSARRYDAAGGRPQLVGLVSDITDRKRQAEVLRDSEQRFRSTFENAAVGVAHVGLDGSWLSVNGKFAEMVGYSTEELLCRTFQDITHPQDLAADLGNVQQVLTGDIQSYSMDKRYIRKDGSILWAALTVALQRDASGAPAYFISIINDILPRKRAEEHQHFLMRELSHRTKNLLAIIQSMSTQTAKSSASIEEFGDRFGQRLQALAASHDLLIDGNWSGADLKALVSRQLSSFADPGDPRLTLSGPAVTLTTESAQSIGLALHELATNAVKYGALSCPAGTVAVWWALDDASVTPRLLHLSWTERGGPTVTSPSRSGFGRTVIERLTAAALSGKVILQYPPEGAVWHLDVPATCLALGDTSERPRMPMHPLVL